MSTPYIVCSVLQGHICIKGTREIGANFTPDAPAKPGHPPENLQTTHSYLRNLIKGTELWPPSPSSTSGRNQQEVNIQEQDRNRHYFCLPKRRCMRVGETVISSHLASRVFTLPHTSRPC